MKSTKLNRPTGQPLVRCAIYTRKSTEEGLEQEFNSLHAQREAAEAYIASQRHEGWQCVPTQYDDGGFTGGNTDRPALKRLLADIESGLVDCVMVYKVDRLSRSLLDFTQMMESFDRQGISFVSVTQKFDTGSSMGRLMLNVLLSFAQFEREIIGERTRDKIAAMRRKGKWSGGLPPLGYDADPNTSKLVINPDEAAQVRTIFDLYLQHGSLLPVVEALKERGWNNKRSTTKKGTERGGFRFNRNSVHRTLTNVLYTGRVRHKDEIHPGEHAAIIDEGVFGEVQTRLARNSLTGGAEVRGQSGALLKGLLRCSACDSAMSPTYTAKNGRKYRYYLCGSAQKNGRKTCPTKSVPAGAIETFVVDRIRHIGRDPDLVRETVAAVQAQERAERDELAAKRRRLDQEHRQATEEAKTVSNSLGTGESGPALVRLGELRTKIADLEQRLERSRREEAQARSQSIDEHEIACALAEFDNVWAALTPREQANLIGQLLESVSYDGPTRSVQIQFHPDGLGAIRLDNRTQETARC